MNREPQFTNTRQGKASLRPDAPHNRKPGGAADMRVIRWRAWRREAHRWLRALVRER